MPEINDDRLLNAIGKATQGNDNSERTYMTHLAKCDDCGEMEVVNDHELCWKCNQEAEEFNKAVISLYRDGWHRKDIGSILFNALKPLREIKP